MAIAGYFAIAAVSMSLLPLIFPELRWYHVVVLYIIAPPLVFCNSYGCGLTDWSLASTYGRLVIFIIGAWAGPAHGGVVAGLVACGVMMNIVSTGADLMQDLKTGYVTQASPRSVFISQVIGTAMGCIISPSVFIIYYKAFGDLGVAGSKYPAPVASVYRSVAQVGVEGFSSLPTNCLSLCYGFFAAAMVINAVRNFAGEKWWSRYIPVPMAMAMPFYIGSYFGIDMCIGSLILFAWERINKAGAEAFAAAVASGLICGEGIWSLPSSILAIAGARSPFCLKFLYKHA
ncbi:hypothetical protein CRG98_043839 [Punica granatum]|nr:hypothetical protein CRG98_043839 [Punica granatum]